ncbi:hypothetical protein RintRC_0942 [Richelia intracellularis]|nr:hypothetical protein RintRC_0942 [Richelia intracellularis]
MGYLDSTALAGNLFFNNNLSKYLAQVSTGLGSCGVSLGKVPLRRIPAATELDLPALRNQGMISLNVQRFINSFKR